MKIGVIGTVNRDTVKLPDGSIKKGWGGILYNLSALSDLFGEKAEIYPVCNVGADCYRPIMRILKSLPGVRADFVKKVPEKNNHCFLTYLNHEDKNEILAGGVRRLNFENISPLLECNLILVNYISGADIYLSSLLKLRRHYTGPIYIDIHSLTLGRRGDGSRYLRRPKYWGKVASAGDYIQMNRRELSILTGRKASSGENEIIENSSAFFRILSDEGTDQRHKCLIVTDGSSGCFLIYRNRSRIQRMHVLPQRIVRKGNTTGCGDCFSAGFIYGLQNNKDLAGCAREGNRAAGRRILGYIKKLRTS